MSTYRPDYGIPQQYPPPPPPPLPYVKPPLPPGSPPAYDPYRGGDPYRPPSSDFSFRNSDSWPQPPRVQDRFQSNRPPEYFVQDNGRSQPRRHHSDNVNLNQAKRGNRNMARQSYRAVPADRPLLRRHDEGGSDEQMLGMVKGQTFIAAEDVSDSDEERMDESDSELQDGSGHGPPMDTLAGDDRAEEAHEPPVKRRALTSDSKAAQSGASEPKWSNPDPYTVLPPLDEASRKRKDVVKLIRKARKGVEEVAAERNQAAANDDFISFSIDEAVPSSPSVHELNGNARGVPGAPSGPRGFSHLHNLHGQEAPRAPGTSIGTTSAQVLGPPPDLAPNPPKVPEKVVLDLGRSNYQNLPAYGGDENLGNRKRTHDDSIKGRKKGNVTNNGSILHDWKPISGMDPVPWLQKTDMITANAGFRLHKEICDFYDFVRPKDFEQTIRQELLSRLQTAVNNHLPNTTVLCFGSFAAGIYLPNADMDVVVVSNTFRSTGNKVTCQAPNQMLRFARHLEISGLAKMRCEVIAHAKVPIVKFVDSLTGIRVDVSFENDTGVIANDTFASWKRQFPAMPVLVTIIKQFLMMRGLNEVQHGGLGGFSVTCLVTSLLQNMPRVQSGHVVPEQHLGEMLLEFLDFYGNRLDTTRTGIFMRPPGYFEKRTYIPPNKRGPVYQGNKSDRLAIIDPNRADNDISGGSREVMLIFDRFSRAHGEILQAMKSPDRISLLDWLLGGNYESFASQRSHLLDLYQEKWGSPAGLPAQPQLPEVCNLGSRCSSGLRGGNDLPGDRASSLLRDPTGHQAGNSFIQPKFRRAAELKAKYPDMKVPNRVSLKREQQLIAEHHAGRKQKSKKSNEEKKKNRALRLKKKYPDMENIPDGITPAERRAFVAAYEERKSAEQRAPVQSQSVHPTQLPQRPVLSSYQPFPDSNLRSRPVSNKMAPLSDERRAEVARNLSGHSNDDPINLD